MILYSNNCPQCNVLKVKLNSYGIEYETVTDQQKMLEMGMTSMPMFDNGEKLMTFRESIEWLNTLKKEAAMQ